MKRRARNSGRDLVIQKREEEAEIVFKKRPRDSESIVGRKAKVLYDKGTPNEKWWVAVIVGQHDDTNYEVSNLDNDEFKLIETQKNTQIGKKIQIKQETGETRPCGKE